MVTGEEDESSPDLEAGPQLPAADLPEDSDGSLCFSDADDRSWHSRCGEELPFAECCCTPENAPTGGDEAPPADRQKQCAVDIDIVDGALLEINSSPEKTERDCRICHLGLEDASSDPDSGVPILLGCSCKNDLAVAHQQCAETWFKIRGNRTCEICGSTAHNVIPSADVELSDQSIEADSAVAAAVAAAAAAVAQHQRQHPRRFWHGHRFLNFLLACMVFAFVISWLFHFNVPG